MRANDGYDINLDCLFDMLAKKEDVVVLIDNHDSPLIENIDSEQLENIASVLRRFYNILKAKCKNIRLCFVTGATGFLRSGFLSGMNNLMDISIMDVYSSALGYTQNEFETYFAEYIDSGVEKSGLTRKDYLGAIKSWYGGYSFSGEEEVVVYNPLSINCFFSKGGIDFKNYWTWTSDMTMLLTESAECVKSDISLSDEMKISQ